MAGPTNFNILSSGGYSSAFAWIKVTNGTEGQPVAATIDGRVDGVAVFSSRGIAYIPVSGAGEYKVEGYDDLVTAVSKEYSVVPIGGGGE